MAAAAMPVAGPEKASKKVTSITYPSDNARFLPSLLGFE
jgi:hypothetical protein